MLQEEGLEAAWARHAAHHAALVAGLEALGLRCWSPSRTACRSSTWSSCPRASTRPPSAAGCSSEYDLEVGAGLGALAGKVWRVGLMGYAARPENVVKCLRSFAKALGESGANVSGDEAEKAARAVLQAG